MLLPQSVGPGPVTLVMREVLTMLINVAYKSSRVLRELQLDGPPNAAMQTQVLGAKYVRRLIQSLLILETIVLLLLLRNFIQRPFATPQKRCASRKLSVKESCF